MRRFRSVGLVGLTLLALGATNGTDQELSKREQIRAFVQVQALKELAKWEAKKLYPDNAAMRTVEEKRAVRQAFTMVAGQYQIRSSDLRKVVQRGLLDKWPRPGALQGGTDIFLVRHDQPRAWRKIISAKALNAPRMKLVKDRRASGGLALETTTGVRLAVLECPVRLPGPGRYRASFYCLAHKRVQNRPAPYWVHVCVDQHTPAGRRRHVGARMLGYATMTRTVYAPCVVDFTVGAKDSKIMLGGKQSGVIWRLDRVVIEKID